MPGSWRDVLSANALSRSRDAPRIRALLKAEKATPKSPPLKEGRRSADKRIHRAASKSDAARVRSPVFPVGGKTEAQDFIEPWTSKNGAGALAFRRPTAASEVFTLGSAWAALPGT